jgi:hypothetical protein
MRDVVIATKDLAPVIVATREECEQSHHVLAEMLAANGLADVLPRSMGGSELPPLTVFQAIETLSSADGSIGWCACSPLWYRCSRDGYRKTWGATSLLRGRMRSTAAIQWSDIFAIFTSPFSTTVPLLHNTSRRPKY